MAEGKPNWIGYAVVALLAFGAGRSCQSEQGAAPAEVMPVFDDRNADVLAAEAAQAASEAAAAVAPDRAPPPAIRPVYSAPAPTYQTPAYVDFANCSEARNAGAAPVRRGQPGYGSHLDRDGDGVGCE
jgi:hypothetical protein